MTRSRKITWITIVCNMGSICVIRGIGNYLKMREMDILFISLGMMLIIVSLLELCDLEKK